MGLRIFVSMLNSVAQSQPDPVDTGFRYVSVNGTGTGFTESDPMSVEDFLAEEQADNRVVRFFKGEEI